MATQRLTVAAIVGIAADHIAARFRSWQTGSTLPDPLDVDQFGDRLRANCVTFPVIYFAEWIDHWLMGDLVPGAGAVRGSRFEVACLSRSAAVELAEACGDQFPEQQWLAMRLHEAVAAWELVKEERVVVVLREVLGPSVADDEIRESCSQLPEWLAFSESK